MPNVLIILDCCFAANAARDTAEGTTKEILAACGRESPTLGVCERSFTSVLIEEMLAFGNTPFTVAMLHSRLVTMRWRLAFTPIYALLSEHGGDSIAILRSPKPRIPTTHGLDRPSHAIAELDGTAIATTNGPTSAIEDLESPSASDHQMVDSRVLLSVSVSQPAELELREWTKWLTTAAPWNVMKVDVQIHSMFKSHSTLVLASVPINAWSLLPENTAYRFVGFIRSDNLLDLEKSPSALAIVGRSKSKWPSPISSKYAKRSPELDPDLMADRPPCTTSKTSVPYPDHDRTQPSLELLLDSLPQPQISGPWSSFDDDQLRRARQQGLEWQQIASEYFPGKTANTCRKRNERLMEKANQAAINSNRDLQPAGNDSNESNWNLFRPWDDFNDSAYGSSYSASIVPSNNSSCQPVNDLTRSTPNHSSHHSLQDALPSQQPQALPPFYHILDVSHTPPGQTAPSVPMWVDQNEGH